MSGENIFDLILFIILNNICKMLLVSKMN